MSLFRVGISATAFVMITATAALAHSTAPIDRTQAWQMRQIQDGRDNGSLTRREYAALMAEQARIAEMERRALRNGVTGHEFRIIRRAQRDAANHILNETTNNRVNIWRRWKTRYGH
ncbi:MAG: hypothetical protein R3D67_19810 [Hyphomicrobiaceae bacterium]